MSSLFEAIAKLSPQLSAHSLGMACWSLSKLNAPPRAFTPLASALMKMLRHGAKETNSDLVPQVGVTKTLLPQGSAFDTKAASASPRLDAKALAAAAISLVKAEALSPSLLMAIAEFCSLGPSAGYSGDITGTFPHGAMGASEAAQIFWSIATASPPHALRSNPSLLRAVRDLSSVVGDSVGAPGPGLCMASSPSANYAVPFFPSGQICMYIAACAAVGFHPGEATLQGAAKALEKSGIAGLSSHTLCELLASLAQLGAGATPLRPSPQHFSSTPVRQDSGPGTNPIPEARVAAVHVVPWRNLSAGSTDCGGENNSGGCGGPVGRLVRGTVAVLTFRLVVRRQEILTLGSALQLAWALACLPRAMWWNEREALARRPLRRRRLRWAARPEAPDDGADEDDGDVGDYGDDDAALGSRTCWKALRQKYWRLRGFAGGGGRLFPALTVSAPRLLTFAASKVLGSPPDALNDKPKDLRRLVEVYGLLVSPCNTYYCFTRNTLLVVDGGRQGVSFIFILPHNIL